jgi:hypothetical protein
LLRFSEKVSLHLGRFSLLPFWKLLPTLKLSQRLLLMTLTSGLRGGSDVLSRVTLKELSMG